MDQFAPTPQTLQEIFDELELSPFRLEQLSNEAKLHAIDCGKLSQDKHLSEETWSLLQELSDEVWKSDMSASKKIELGFQLFELFPHYYHFLVPFYLMIEAGEMVSRDEKKIIWTRFMQYLASENYYADTVAYVLWVEFFEDHSLVAETWEGLTANYSDKKSLLQLLECAGPVPFDLKIPYYYELLTDESNHESIFKSLKSSATDVYGQIDPEKALDILDKMQIDRTSNEYKQLTDKLRKQNQ